MKETSHALRQREIYSSFTPPTISTDPYKLEQEAKDKISESAWNYINGSAGPEHGSTDLANRRAFTDFVIIPRMLRDVTKRNCSITLFGKVYDSPILLAPIGVQDLAHRDAEEATARAATSQNVPMILSTAATRTIEQVASASGSGDRWFQLYWPKSDAITISLLDRARNAGYSVLVVTVDTFNLGFRPKDLDTAFLPFLYGQGSAIGFSDPVFTEFYDSLPIPSLRDQGRLIWGLGKRGGIKCVLDVLLHRNIIRKSQAWLNEMNSATYKTWSQIPLLKTHWKGPIVIKGIQSVEDARMAIECKCDGIVVSNHGGRQISGSIASLHALANIAADPIVRASGITILFDSGIRTGSDILKALSLGARGVLLGRPYLYGLACAGQRGVEEVLLNLKADLEITMGCAGVKDLSPEALEGLVVPVSRPVLQAVTRTSKL